MTYCVAVRVDQVQHEFSTIPHVTEDTTELLLNVRAIRLKALSDRPAKLFLDVTGEREVTAADLEVPGDYEIVNPDLHIATMDSPDARLTATLDVERGVGYVPAGEAAGLAAAHRAITLQADVANLPGVVRGAPIELAVEDQARTKTGSEGQEEHILRSVGAARAKIIFSQGAGIGIVFEVDRRLGECFLEDADDRDIAPARQVRGFLDQARLPVHR